MTLTLIRLLLAVALLLPFPVFSQWNREDSLRRELENTDLNLSRRVEVLLQLSDIHLARNPDRSFAYTRQAMELSRSSGDRRLLGLSFRSLGNCYNDRGDHDSAQVWLHRTLELLPEDPLTLYYLGQNEWFNGEEGRCTEYYDRAERSSLASGDYKTLGIVYYSYADYYRYHHEDSLAQRYITASVKLLEKTTSYRDLAMAYNIQAEIYRSRGDYALAMETYIRTATLAYRELDSNRIGYCFSRMGYICYMQNDFERAEIYLVRALEIAEKVRARNLKLFCLKALTDMYSFRVDESRCRYYAGLCLQASHELGDATGEALAYSSLSNLFYRRGEMDSAAVYASLSYRVARENDDYLNMLNALVNQLPLEYDAGNYIRVIQLTSEGIELAQSTETKEHFRNLYEYRYMALEKLGRDKEAFSAFRMFKAYQDSLQNDSVRLSLDRTNLELDYRHKHLQDTLSYIEGIQEERQETALARQRSRYQLLIGGVVVLLFTAIVLIIRRAYRRQKLLNRSLEESNRDKELLLREIHHRVKNSLQMVSSLLSLQRGRNAGDLKEIIDDSQMRINNIAIVHELLYQSTRFRDIDLRQYLDKLIAHILGTYNTSLKPIRVHTHIEALRIDLDKSVPLALVLNEVLTNSVKYAFAGRTEGDIYVNCQRKGGSIELEVSDNGVGLPGLSTGMQGIGIQLIQGLARQLNGRAEWHNRNGCFFVFSFPG